MESGERSMSWRCNSEEQMWSVEGGGTPVPCSSWRGGEGGGHITVSHWVSHLQPELQQRILMRTTFQSLLDVRRYLWNSLSFPSPGCYDSGDSCEFRIKCKCVFLIWKNIMSTISLQQSHCRDPTLLEYLHKEPASQIPWNYYQLINLAYVIQLSPVLKKQILWLFGPVSDTQRTRSDRSQIFRHIKFGIHYLTRAGQSEQVFLGAVYLVKWTLFSFPVLMDLLSGVSRRYWECYSSYPPI